MDPQALSPGPSKTLAQVAQQGNRRISPAWDCDGHSGLEAFRSTAIDVLDRRAESPVSGMCEMCDMHVRRDYTRAPIALPAIEDHLYLSKGYACNRTVRSAVQGQ